VTATLRRLAPLRPNVGWYYCSVFAFANANTISPHQWCFVPRQHMLDVTINIQVTSVARNVTMIERSHDATRYEVRGGRPANLGIDVAHVESVIGRKVPIVTITDVPAPARGRGQSAGNGAVGFFRPTIRPAAPDHAAPAPPPQIQQRPTIDAAVIQRQRDAQQRKLESDLVAERGRLARDQQAELQAQKQQPAAAVEQIRTRHATEQQAFEAHATQQRQVLAQRIQKQIVNPGKGKPANNGNGKGKNKDKGNNGNGPDKGNP
jgi:hypothetical protein